MIRYRFFAIDGMGRVDRGFEQFLVDDDAAYRFAESVEGAATVEVLRGSQMIARVRHHNGRATVIPAL